MSLGQKLGFQSFQNKRNLGPYFVDFSHLQKAALIIGNALIRNNVEGEAAHGLFNNGDGCPKNIVIAIHHKIDI